MILEKELVATITKVVSLAKLFNIESFVIERTFISGISENTTAAIYVDRNNDIGCNAIALNRMSVLQSRMALIEQESTEIECVYHNEAGDAESLKIKSPKLTVDYRCAKSKKIKYPTSLAVNDLYSIQIPDDLHSMLTKSKTAMARATEIVVMSNDNEISYKLVDESNDTLLYKDGFSSSVLTEGDDVNFVIRYPIKLFLLAIRHASDGYFYITEKDMLKVHVNDICVYVPKVKLSLND